MNYWYFSSLKGCPIEPYDVTEWVEWIKLEGNTFLKEVFLAATIFTIIIILSFYRIISKVWLILFVLNVIIFWLYQSGSDLIVHGGINSFGIIVLTIIEVVLFSITMWIKNICKKGKGWAFAISIILIVLPTTYYFGLIHHSCRGWMKGFGGRKLINAEGYWNIVPPRYWELAIRDGWFDVNRFSQSCQNIKMKVISETLPERIKTRNIKRLGYPRQEYFPNEAKISEFKLVEVIDENIIDMDDPSIPKSVKDNIEFVVDMSDPHSHIIKIDVKRNDTRAEELIKVRKEIINEDKINNKTGRIDKDVLIIFIDNISRTNFKRKLKKTSTFLDQLANNKDSDYEVFEYFRYHSIETNTLRNMNALYYGQDEYLKTESKNIYQYFSKNGYITGIFIQEWWMMQTLFDPNMTYSEPFYHFDHQPGSLFCDSNFDRTWAGTQCFGDGRNSPFLRWLYGQSTGDIVLNYTTQFWEKYPDVRKFFAASFDEAHEFSGDLIKYNDKSFRKFLQYFQDKGYLKDMQLLIMSDHGAHMIVSHAPLYPDDSRFEENMLPVLFYITPKNISEKNLKFLENNQQQFMNSHDFYATLKSIAVGEASGAEDIVDYAINYEQLPKGRDCNTQKDIRFSQCWCQNDISKIYEKKNKYGYFYIGFIIE